MRGELGLHSSVGYRKGVPSSRVILDWFLIRSIFFVFLFIGASSSLFSSLSIKQPAYSPFTSSETLIKSSNMSKLIISENDTRKYRQLTLDNELDVLLINDEESDKVLHNQDLKFSHFFFEFISTAFFAHSTAL